MFGKRRMFRKKSANNVDGKLKLPYDTYNPHTLQPLVHSEVLESGSNYLVGAFIDPGIKNCAIRIAKKDLLTDKVTTIMQMKFDFTTEEGVCHYVSSISILDRYIEEFRWCHYIVMERQMTINYDLVRFSQHLITYFSMRVKNLGFRPLIIEINSKMKSHLLGGKLKMTKPELKKWCRDKAIEILTERDDTIALNVLLKAKKQDDHGDVVCYEKVWWGIIQDGLQKPPIPITHKEIKIYIKPKE